MDTVRDFAPERFSRPAARPRRGAGWIGRLCKAAVIALVLVGTAVGLWEGYRRFLRLPYFRVAEVRVEGNLQVAAADATAGLGLTSATSILEVDLAELSRRLRLNPWIKEAQVRRQLPVTLIIHVVERVPEAVFVADRRYLLSADGVILAELEGDDLPTLPILRAATPRRVTPGERILSSEMAQGLSVWRQFQLANAVQGERAHEIAMAADGSYVVTLGAQMPVIRLRAQELEEQFRRLGAALAAGGKALTEFVDVDLRFRDRVIFRPASGR
jgi:hypothetical protein